MDSFPDGVWFLELAPVTDPALIPYTLANLLGLRESTETKQTISELVCGYLHARKALLVFDNCEHLIEACARLADLLLHSCKDLRILPRVVKHWASKGRWPGMCLRYRYPI